MSDSFCFTNANVLIENEFRKMPFAFEGESVVEAAEREIDLTGFHLLPGIIDLHGDGFERHLNPRPSAAFDKILGLQSTERELAANGITTAYLAQAYSWEGGYKSPTYAKDLVNVILGMLNSKVKPKNKIYNYSNEGFTNWYDFAKKIFELKRINCQIMPVDSENYKTIAKRPKYSVTDKSRIKDIFNISVRNWEDALKEFIFNYK